MVDITKPNAQDSISLQELALYHAIMDYRESLGLSAIALSKALSATAGRHVVDTRENIWRAGLDLPEGANLHSWSDAPYFGDHRDPDVMWEAPQRLGTGYTSPGFEISAAGYDDIGEALAAWKNSPGHNIVIANKDAWADIEFLAIGVGVDTSAGPGPFGGSVYHVWFGQAADPRVPTILGGGGRDRIEGTAFADRVTAGGGDDTVLGGAGGDTLSGGAGRDTLTGGAGDDRLDGQAGDDSLLGGSGSDTLVGGTGTNRLDGGVGSDTFLFAKLRASDANTIVGFKSGSDEIDLDGIDADRSERGDQEFEFIGSAGFSGEAGELRYRGGKLSGDVDGDGKADFTIALKGAPKLIEDDILL